MRLIDQNKVFKYVRLFESCYVQLAIMALSNTSNTYDKIIEINFVIID